MKVPIIEDRNEPDNQPKRSYALSVLKDSICNTCKATSLHGVPRFLNSSNYKTLRLFWLVFFFASAGACVYYCYKSLKLHFDYTVSVAVKTTQEYPVEFPMVTFCNVNPFNSGTSGNLAYLQSILRANNINPSITASSTTSVIYQVKEALGVLKANIRANSTISTSSLYNIGFTIETMLISCYFNGVKCSSSDFNWYYTYEYGNCYQFNKKLNSSTSLSKTSKTGPTSGLSLELFIGVPGIQDYFSVSRGLYVGITNNTQNPLPRYEGSYIPVGYETNIGIKRTFIYKKDSPFSDCRKDIDTAISTDSTYFNFTIGLSKYSRKLCYEICLQNSQIIPNCSCSDPAIPVTSTTQKICTTLSDLACVTKIRQIFDSSSITTVCSKYCPQECDTINYDTSFSMADYPTSYYYNIISADSTVSSKFTSVSGTMSVNTYKASTLLLNVFYDDLYYTTITEDEEYSLETVISLVGGNLGLFLGCSVLSLFESIELIYVFIRKTISYHNSSNGVKPFLNKN